jgi:hypothetical protein
LGRSAFVIARAGGRSSNPRPFREIRRLGLLDAPLSAGRDDEWDYLAPARLATRGAMAAILPEKPALAAVDPSA